MLSIWESWADVCVLCWQVLFGSLTFGIERASAHEAGVERSLCT